MGKIIPYAGGMSMQEIYNFDDLTITVVHLAGDTCEVSPARCITGRMWSNNTACGL